MQEIHKIYSYLGGSHAYGLNNADSDTDERGVFINTKKSRIFGLEIHEHQENKETDTFYFELRNFFRLARKGNTQVMEALFNKKHILQTKQFQIIQDYKYSLLDSTTIYKTLRGYSQGEKNIVFALSTVKLGEKRKAAVEKYGYSYRNAVHALRLLRSGVVFFQTNSYPVNIVAEDKEMGQLILDIKNNPKNYHPKTILEEIERQEVVLEDAFNKRGADYSFDVDLAAELCLLCYQRFFI